MKKMLFSFYIGLIGLVICTVTITMVIVNPLNTWYIEGGPGVLGFLVQNGLILFTSIGLLLVVLAGWLMYKEIKVAG